MSAMSRDAADPQLLTMTRRPAPMLRLQSSRNLGEWIFWPKGIWW